jgi:hypothetical protein
MELLLKELVGKQITSAVINRTKDLVILGCPDGDLFLSWLGDCCAHCYLANVSGIDELIGSTITEARHSQWQDTNSLFPRGDDVIESMGTTLKTTKGYVTFESRVEHNGYYGGYIEISQDEPLGQYNEVRQIDSIMDKLEDF